MATALQQRPPVAVIMDEMEHYRVEQVIAFGGLNVQSAAWAA